MMDSNSGSVQSSSGGEDYDDPSRAGESLPSFLNPPPSSHHHHHLGQGMFDPLSNYFDPSPLQHQLRNSNPLLLNNHPEIVWSSRNPRSDLNPPDLSYFMSSSSQFFNSTTSSQILPAPLSENIHNNNSTCSNSNSNISASASQPANSAPNDRGNIGNTATASAVRPSKKRSRASRRAPTTVLTTDTTNFRAMVQEFTGIPAPPFTSSSQFTRARLDLFPSSSGGGLGGGSIMMTQPPPCAQPPYRPFAQKLCQAPSNFFSSPSSSTLLDNNNNNSSIRNIISTTSNEFLNLNNNNKSPLLNFPASSSLYQQPLKYPLPNLSNLISSNTQRTTPLEILQNDQFGLGQVSTSKQQELMNGVDHHLDGGSNYGGNSTLQQVTINGKMNYSGSSSDKVPPSENTSGRSEGMVESWIT